jgi:flagellar motor switch protein FliM
MTGPSVSHLGKARIRQLLAAIGSVPSHDPAVGEVVEYDWRDPHCLNGDQLGRLAAAMNQVAARLGDVFTRFFGRRLGASVATVSQHFANDLHRSVEPDRGFCLTFGPDNGPPCGFLTISSRTAMTWVVGLLGDSESDGHPDRPLSALEESLLSDLAAAALEAFLTALRPHHNLKGSSRLSKGQPSIQFELIEEICRIVFRIQENGKGNPSDLIFVLPCGRLAALVGKAPAPASRATPQELSHTLMEHLQQMPVTVTARLAATTVSVYEVLDLGPGDILLLDKPIHEMVDLIIEDRTAFRGRPAQSAGQYAVFIEESPAGATQQEAAAKTASEFKKGQNAHA